jgi:quercetin dioxygenase-like cupin family protein
LVDLLMSTDIGLAETTAWESVVADEVLPGITRQVIHGEQQTMVRYVYAPGSVFPVHAHPEEQITVVVSGRIAFTIVGIERELGPGGVAVIPANVPHGAHVVGDETVETFNSLSPRRLVNPLDRPSESESVVGR